MADKKIRYDDIRLEIADNGFILGYTEIKRRPNAKEGASRWDNEMRDYKKEVFQWADGPGAIKRMTELAVDAHPQAAKALGAVKEKVEA